MKKTGSILLLIFSVIFLAGCSETYNAEKAVWKANKMANKIFVDPKSKPEGQYIQVIEAYEKVIRKYPKTAHAGEARFKMGLLYMAKEDYKTAQEMFNKVIVEHPDKVDLCANARFIVGNCYEKAGDWDNAYLEYKKTFNDYTKTIRGLLVPYYIANYYQQKKDFVKAEKEFNDAVNIYNKLAKENPGTPLNYAALGYVVLCFESQSKWEEAIGGLKAIYENYSNTQEGSRALITMGMIYQKHLSQFAKAIEIYEEYINKYPESKIIPNLKTAIEQLKPK